MELIHTDIDKEEKGWKESTTYKEYFFDKATGQVTLVMTVNCDNPYPGKESYRDREIGRKVLAPNEIPPVVRNKIEKLMAEK